MFREMLQAVWRSHIGKIGLALFLVFGIGSAVVLATYPRDFGPRVWNNPAYWADYPKLAPPKWVSGEAQHQVLRVAPEETTENGRKVLSYRFRVALSQGADPSFLSFSLADVRFQNVSPIVEVSLEDGDRSVFLSRHIVPGRGADEPSPVTRYREVPFRQNLTSDFAMREKAKAFFEALRQGGVSSFTAVVRADLADADDAVGAVTFVAGGDRFGLLGTDTVGRDIWQGILFGLPIALLFVGLPVALVVTFLGALMGGISGYVGGRMDTLSQRFIDLMTMIPVLPIIIFLVFAFGSRLAYVVAILIVFGWTGLAIQLRPWVMQIRESGFIALARARGLRPRRIILRHVLPQTMPFLFASFVFTVPGAILAEAGLSFLGLGDPSLPTWGVMLQQGFQTGALNSGYWWWVLPPGFAIVLTSLAFALVYHPLEPFIEPRLRKQ